MDGKMTSGIGFALLIVAFLVFLFFGNVAPAIVLLALGVIFVTAGGWHKAGAKESTESPK
jgi:membrane-bound ClpP family serine protease